MDESEGSEEDIEDEIYSAIEDTISSESTSTLEDLVEASETINKTDDFLEQFKEEFETSYQKHLDYSSESEDEHYPYEEYKGKYDLVEACSASYLAAMDYKDTMESAELLIENASSERTLGIPIADFEITKEQKAKIEDFKSLHIGEWFVMCANPGLYIFT